MSALSGMRADGLRDPIRGFADLGGGFSRMTRRVDGWKMGGAIEESIDPTYGCHNYFLN